MGILRSSEQCLLADSKEKEDLISNLMRTVRSEQPLEDGSNPAKGAVAPTARRGSLGRSLWGRAQRDSQAEVNELERVAEESMKDNLRLRNDLRVIAAEFHKTLAMGKEKALEQFPHRLVGENT